MSDDLKAAVKAAEAVGITITGVPKLGKLPKTKMGGLVDSLHEMTQLRLAVSKVADAIKAQEKAITDHIIENVSADEGGLIGRRYKAVIKRETIPVVEDWEAFYAHVKKTNGFDLLNRAINRAGYKERAEAGKAVPGVGTFQAKKLSVTKV